MFNDKIEIFLSWKKKSYESKQNIASICNFFNVQKKKFDIILLILFHSIEEHLNVKPQNIKYWIETCNVNINEIKRKQVPQIRYYHLNVVVFVLLLYFSISCFFFTCNVMQT